MAIKVTSSMVSRLQSALTELSIEFLVAPQPGFKAFQGLLRPFKAFSRYEADAQLAYMCRRGLISTAISEDSDLLAYGCPSVLFKMDKYGNGDYVALPCLQVDHVGSNETELAKEGKKGKKASLGSYRNEVK